MSFNEPINYQREDAICRDSWWIGATRDQFYDTARKRLDLLRAAYGSQPVSVPPSDIETRFFDRKGRK